MKCRSCNAPIDFVKTPKGRNVPVNLDYVAVEPVKGGPIAVVTDAGEVVHGKAADATTAGLVVRGRVSHFASCPNADQHRRAR